MKKKISNNIAREIQDWLSEEGLMPALNDGDENRIYRKAESEFPSRTVPLTADEVMEHLFPGFVEKASASAFTVKEEKNDLGKTEYVVYNGAKKLTAYRDYDVAVQKAKGLEMKQQQKASAANIKSVIARLKDTSVA